VDVEGKVSASVRRRFITDASDDTQLKVPKKLRVRLSSCEGKVRFRRFSLNEQEQGAF
jgi:hypothetical protein